MSTPDDRVYAETHEWHMTEGEIVTIGLTRFAVDQLTDVTFVEMREPGTVIEPGESVGEVESVKTTSDIYSVVGGEIIEVNTDLDGNPELVNQNPFTKGWLVKIRLDDEGTLSDCVDSDTYDSDYAV